METKVITAHVPRPLADQVDALASRLERPRGWIVKQALQAWVDLEEERRRMTIEAADISEIPLYNEDVRAEGFPPAVESLFSSAPPRSARSTCTPPRPDIGSSTPCRNSARASARSPSRS